MHFTVRAPASSANLGPGFDALGLALDLWNELTVDTAVDTDSVLISGRDAALLEDKENYTLLAMRELAALYGMKLPPMAMRLTADVPVARGLGSSAAALVCGLIAANLLLDLQLTNDEVYQQAWQMEGHGDNVGAAIYGGVVLAVPGIPRVLQLSNGADLGLVAVVYIPEATSATWAARAALPANVPLPDAAYNLGVAAGLAVGLLTRDMEAIGAGMHDRLHEPYRARLFSHLTPMTDAARLSGAVGACLSGAGPTILALASPEVAPLVAEALIEVAEEHRVVGRVEVLQPIAQGVQVLVHSSSEHPNE